MNTMNSRMQATWRQMVGTALLWVALAALVYVPSSGGGGKGAIIAGAGFVAFANAEWGGDDFTCVTRDRASIYLSEGAQGQPGTWVWLGVEDVEALHDEYRQSGATILEPPENFPWAREMKVGDPDGHVLRFGSDPNDDA